MVVGNEYAVFYLLAFLHFHLLLGPKIAVSFAMHRVLKRWNANMDTRDGDRMAGKFMERGVVVRLGWNGKG